jgi:hypothetical protein
MRSMPSEVRWGRVGGPQAGIYRTLLSTASPYCHWNRGQAHMHCRRRGSECGAEPQPCRPVLSPDRSMSAARSRPRIQFGGKLWFAAFRTRVPQGCVVVTRADMGRWCHALRMLYGSLLDAQAQNWRRS